MAADDREVIKEFLVSLGFNVPTVEVARFTSFINGSTKLVGKLAAVVVGVSVSAEALVTAFARSMEKLYYSSQRTKASAENLKSIKFAFKQIGLSADEAMGSVEAYAQGLRTQPGLKALQKHLGLEETGDAVTDLVQLIKLLSSLPHEIGAQYAQTFGIPEQIFLQWKQNMPEFEAQMKRYVELQRASGVSADQAAKDSREYMNALRDLWKQVELLWAKLAHYLLPAFHRLHQSLGRGLESITKWIDSGFKLEMGEWNESVRSLIESLGELKRMFSDDKEANWFNTLFAIIKSTGKQALHVLVDIVAAIAAIAAGRYGEAWNRLKSAGKNLVFAPEGEFGLDVMPGSPGVGSGKSAASKWRPRTNESGPVATGREGQPAANDREVTPASMFATLEEVYGLPPGLLDKMWQRESNRGDPRFMLSKKGARGHFGFMGPTAKQYGVEDPNNLGQAASGAAEMMSNMLKKYGGSLPHALAAYNWGEGRLDKYGLDKAPKETRDYISKIAGVTINQTTTIHVAGTNNPNEVAGLIANRQQVVNSDLVRNAKGALQ